MARAVAKIAHGPAYKEGTTWFQQLADKRKWISGLFIVLVDSCTLHTTIGKSTKTHFYWAMKNCDGSGDDLRARILNIIKHYQVYSTRVASYVNIFYCHVSRVVW